MRKILFLFCVMALVQLDAQVPANAAEKKALPESITPPDNILEKFNKEYPGITASWRMDGQNFKAEFVDPNTLKGNSIVYDKAGNVVRRENEMENASYPESINQYYIKHFPGEKFKTWSSQDDKGERSYYIKRNSETVWFDKEGKYIEPKRK